MLPVIAEDGAGFSGIGIGTCGGFDEAIAGFDAGVCNAREVFRFLCFGAVVDDGQ